MSMYNRYNRATVGQIQRLIAPLRFVPAAVSPPVQVNPAAIDWISRIDDRYPGSSAAKVKASLQAN